MYFCCSILTQPFLGVVSDLTELGVEAIISNKPDLVKSIQDEIQGSAMLGEQLV